MIRKILGLALLTPIVWNLPARAAVGVIPGVAVQLPFSAPAPDVMAGVTLFVEPLPWLVVRGGAYTGDGVCHFPIGLGYVLPGPAEYQLRPRVEVGLDPFTATKGNGTACHLGFGLDYLPFDNDWVIGFSTQLVFGVIGDITSRVNAENRPFVDQWLVRMELGIGYKF